ncbi:radical SAM protein [bacterium]|nr:radical SAM protein [candidate division CSSED10-310 bacterium]
MTLRVQSIFSSIQGESTYQGLPFTFIRLSGCNLRCRWCDTPEAWEPDSGTDIGIHRIIERVNEEGLRHVCVTGGEPLLQAGTRELLRILLETGHVVTLETNGSIDISMIPASVVRVMDIKCPSSGMTDRTLWENIPILNAWDEIKFVISNREDYRYACEVIRSRLACFPGSVLMSPAWRCCSPSDLASWILSDKMPARLQLQLHKFLSFP